MLANTALRPLRRGFLELPLRRLLWAGSLSTVEQDAVRALGSPRRRVSKSGLLVDSETPGPHFILEGWACQMRVMPDGRRQIFAFLLPGDEVCLTPDVQAVADLEHRAITPVTLVDAADLMTYPGITRCLAALRIDRHRRLFDHVVRLGAQNSYERLAHLLLELYTRQAEIGVASGAKFTFPVPQEKLSEMLGLSEVHVSRTITRLRRDGHVDVGHGWVALPKLRQLAQEVGYPESPVW